MTSPSPVAEPNALPPEAIVPVIDVLEGRAVHARCGERHTYRPLEEHFSAPSEPYHLATRFASHFPRIYVADLNAIGGSPPQHKLYLRLSELGREFWIDTGIQTTRDAESLEEAWGDRPSLRPILGLETLVHPENLRPVAAALATHEPVFSLDLREGRPLTNDSESSTGAHAWVRAAVDAGIQDVIVLELTVVGTGGGPAALELCRELHCEFPRLRLFLGGGIRTPADVQAALAAGCRGVLTATALHTGTIPWPGLSRE